MERKRTVEWFRGYGVAPLGGALLGGAWYALGGRPELDFALPLLVAGVVMSWLRSAFSACSSRRLLPRRWRLQLALEYALFVWNGARGVASRTSMLRLLAEAERAASAGSPLRDDIARVTASVEAGADGPDVDAALADCIARAVPAERDRRPNMRPLRLQNEYLVTLPILLAIGLSVACHVARGPGHLTLDDGLLMLTLYMSLRPATALARQIEDKLRAIRGQSRFRTLLVIDQEREDASSWLAQTFYRGVGHTVVVISSATGGRTTDLCLERSTDCLEVPRARVDDALSAFAPHTDLLVLYSRDESLAARVRATTGLPCERCLCLSRDGWHPSGYRWLDPATLRTLPERFGSRWFGMDPYARSVPGSTALFQCAPRHLLLAGMVGLIGIEHALPLQLLLGLAFVGGAWPELLGRRRRTALSRSRLRAPRAPAFSHRLDPKRLAFYLTMGAFILTVAACGVLVEASLTLWTNAGATVFVLLTSVTAFLVHGYLVDGLLRGLKWWLDWDFRTVILRRNTVHFGYAHKAMVMAEVGKYSQVRVIGDHSIDRTDTHMGEMRESAEGLWLKVFSEMDQMLQPDTFLRTWQRQVLAELELADLAIFDWAEDVTDPMRWELEVSVERLPPHRILLVHTTAHAPEIAALQRRYGPFRTLAVDRKPDDSMIWPSNRQFALGFRDALYQTLSQLAPEPRSCTSPAVTSACALPGEAHVVPG